MRKACYALLFLLLWPLCSSGSDTETETLLPLRTEQLLQIQWALSIAETELQALKKSAVSVKIEQNPDLFARLSKQSELVLDLQNSLEKIVTGGLVIQPVSMEEPPFNWRQELAGIMQPAIESLKQLTSKPRQATELRAAIERITARQQTVTKGLEAIAREKQQSVDAALSISLGEMQKVWRQQKSDLEREKSVLNTQLQALQNDGGNRWQSFALAFEGFLVGRALTLLMAITLAIGVWLLFRLLNRHLWRSRASRRSSPLYRFLMYGFHAFSTIFIILLVFIVFYMRDDVLLLGLGIVVLVGGLLGLRQALPRFLKEVNLLLNLGSAREGERVIYNGVPYCVNSLNVFTILSNPALDGIQRLPLEQLALLFSRPVLTAESWFPCAPGDVLLMSDETLVTVEQQSVEQVVLKSLGGALMHYKTADFFELNLTNLSRSGRFTVSTVFGLDYRYQDNILDAYPELIQAEIPRALNTAGIDQSLYDRVCVEFKTANASSLDLLIWVTFDSQLAASFWKLERVLQQACLRVCNTHNLTIPFPQLEVHGSIYAKE